MKWVVQDEMNETHSDVFAVRLFFEVRLCNVSFFCFQYSHNARGNIFQLCV